MVVKRESSRELVNSNIDSLRNCIDELLAHHGNSRSANHEWKSGSIGELSSILDKRNLAIRLVEGNAAEVLSNKSRCIVQLENGDYILRDVSDRKELEREDNKKNHDYRDAIVFEVWEKVRPVDTNFLANISNLFGGVHSVFSSLLPLVVCTVVLEMLVVIFALVSRSVIDSSIMGKNTSLLISTALLIITFVFVRSCIQVIKHLCIRNMNAQYSFVVADSVFKAVIAQPIDWFSGRNSSDVHNRLESNIVVVKKVILQIADVFTSGVVSIISLIFVFVYAPWVFVLCVLVFSANYILRYKYRNYLSAKYQEYLSAMVDLQRFSIQSFFGISSIKMSCSENEIKNSYGFYVQRLAEAQFKIAEVIANSKVVAEVLGGVVFVALIFYLASSVSDGSLSVGTFFLIIVLYKNYDFNANQLLDLMFDVQEVNVHLKRANQLKVLSGNENSKLINAQLEGFHEFDKLCVMNVSVRFNDVVAGQLDDVSFQIHNNEKILVTGESGSGKSLIARLLAGQLEPSSGSLSMSWENSEFNIGSYFGEIRIVHQNDFLFNGSLLDNITMGEVEPDLARVEVVSKIVGMAELIENMPMKYNTGVGVNTDGVSGGQAQRILIARALYDIPKILILDESTSNLDIDSELALLQNLRQLSCTIVYVSGRKDLENYFDRVIYLG